MVALAFRNWLYLYANYGRSAVDQIPSVMYFNPSFIFVKPNAQRNPFSWCNMTKTFDIRYIIRIYFWFISGFIDNCFLILFVIKPLFIISVWKRYHFILIVCVDSILVAESCIQIKIVTCFTTETCRFILQSCNKIHGTYTLSP